MSNSLAKIEISDGLVEGIIRQQVETALLAALGNDNTKAMVLDGIVKAALNDKVDESGKKSQYASYNTHDYLTVKVTQLIQSITKKVFDEWIAENEAELAKLIRKQLDLQAKGIAGDLVRGLAQNASSSWRTTVNVSLESAIDN